LQISVSEAAEHGKANEAVCALLAEILDRPRSSVNVVTGASAREKLLAVTGNPALLVEKLSSL
jgi:uncharacterized protein YggU (UPF0235/DUF167 family)